MALRSTIFKAELNISDMVRNYYADHSVTLARHPSENDERMMVRLLAFALHADEALALGDSVATEDEPSLWRKDLTGALELWIDVGQPDEKRLRKACGRSRQVVVYAYGSGNGPWLEGMKSLPARTENLSVTVLPPAATKALAGMAGRSMRLQVTIQEGQAWVSDEKNTIEIKLEQAIGSRR